MSEKKYKVIKKDGRTFVALDESVDVKEVKVVKKSSKEIVKVESTSLKKKEGSQSLADGKKELGLGSWMKKARDNFWGKREAHSDIGFLEVEKRRRELALEITRQQIEADNIEIEGEVYQKTKEAELKRAEIEYKKLKVKENNIEDIAKLEQELELEKLKKKLDEVKSGNVEPEEDAYSLSNHMGLFSDEEKNG